MRIKGWRRLLGRRWMSDHSLSHTASSQRSVCERSECTSGTGIFLTMTLTSSKRRDSHCTVTKFQSVFCRHHFLPPISICTTDVTATMNDPEIVKPQIPRLPLEELEYLSVSHPIHNRYFLSFGCRTERGTLRAMSRILVHQAATILPKRNGSCLCQKKRSMRQYRAHDPCLCRP